MNIRAILCAATLAILTTTTQSAVAQQGVKIGRLRCNVSRSHRRNRTAV